MSADWVDKLWNIKPGDMLTIAGRGLMVYKTEGRGWSMVVTLIATRVYMSKTGPTNMMRCTLDELMNKLITVHRKIDVKV